MKFILFISFLLIRSTGFGAITYYDFEDQVVKNTSDSPYFDLDAAIAGDAFSIGGEAPEGTDFQFLGNGKDILYIRMTDADSWNVYESLHTYAWIKPFQEGDLIDATRTNQNPGSTMIYGGLADSPWQSQDGSTKSYIGFVNSTTSQKAWLGVYLDVDADSFRLTVTDFAVADFSDSLVAGQTTAVVPEPGETSLLTAVLIGCFLTVRGRFTQVGSKTPV